MEKAGIIERSTSPWASPVVLVKKKSGDWRFCLDYRLLNNTCYKDAYPLPRIDDCLDAVRGSSWFSTLDLASGYWQVSVHPDDREKTAFVTMQGLYQFKVMPFGLANAPATFERLMERVLAGLQWEICLVYLDDIMVFAQNFEEHMSRLSLVLDRVRQAGLKISPKKCDLFKKEVAFLGHIVGNEGISTDPKKIEAVSEWPRPKNATEVRSFLGLCSYYRKFVKGFADIAKSLHKLTGNDSEFHWTEDCEKAFTNLKERLTTAPILGFPLDETPFILDTDASGLAIGSVLSQLVEGQERVVAYYSRTLSDPERNYCVTQRELLAVVMSLKHFHHYLYGRPVVIRTDHGALKWLTNFKRPEGQLARWLEVVNTYNFTIQHRPGRQHNNADALSRRPCSGCHHCKRQETRQEDGAVMPCAIRGIRTSRILIQPGC